MPKLDGTHILERLIKRLKQLEDGEEIAAKEIRSLLSLEQQQELDDAWKEQQLLRKGKKARNDAEEKALGWKSKREVRIEIFKKAIEDAKGGIDNVFDQLQLDAKKRQMRIYMQTLGDALDEGKDGQQARNMANNALTRSGLNRLDGQIVNRLNKRDKEIFELEQKILEKSRNEITQAEQDQLKALNEYEKALNSKGKKPRK